MAKIIVASIFKSWHPANGQHEWLAMSKAGDEKSIICNGESVINENDGVIAKMKENRNAKMAGVAKISWRARKR